ncbi:UvrB/UvrC motif-containing protein [Planctomyces sp. SH-PL62]|uniref:UvrB/UvrC motif-containing protein n=1 Tax=Planctomyces sp. SH-PL62 TaxID=1636152 RepID=UPI00078D39A8|nr:UvrB/UvrC motif-containing protein [Planctomyces sp. SH-PL62]AMV36790.1 UvrB/uvrC motif protein [Planctomyces sp. SH-PL62]
MKCQKCAKPATFHITDVIEKGKHQEFHFCDEHARQHLAPPEEAPTMGKLAETLATQAGLGAASPTMREPSAADKQVCPVCQITFLEFRNSGRLGCPYDYEVFRDELMPLLESIHGETRHSGKVPKRAPRNTQQQTTLIQLRNELKRAVAAEDYEAAAKLRDKIQEIERDQV